MPWVPSVHRSMITYRTVADTNIGRCAVSSSFANTLASHLRQAATALNSNLAFAAVNLMLQQHTLAFAHSSHRIHELCAVYFIIFWVHNEIYRIHSFVPCCRACSTGQYVNLLHSSSLCVRTHIAIVHAFLSLQFDAWWMVNGDALVAGYSSCTLGYRKRLFDIFCCSDCRVGHRQCHRPLSRPTNCI